MTKKKLAVIASRFPYPLNKGDKLRLFHQIKYLSNYFEIYLYAINEENLSKAEQTTVRTFCHNVTTYDLNFLQKSLGIFRSFTKKEPIQVGYFYSKQIADAINDDLVANNIDAVYCQLSRTAPYGMLFKGPVIFDYQDCFSKNYERAFNNSIGFKKIFYKREWKYMKWYENKINKSFAAKTIISDFDKQCLPFDAKNIKVIPNGVDPEYYKPKDIEKEFDLLFTGNMNYQPNIDAGLIIIEQIYPILKSKLPEIKIGIAGNTQNAQILNAANKNIIIIPKVLDMRDMYARTKVYIAPMFTGAGLQNKLLEAMSMRIPCVASELTNLSLKATPEEDIIVASSINDLANASLQLLESPSRQKEIGKKGQDFIHKNYSWDTANSNLLQLIKQQL